MITHAEDPGTGSGDVSSATGHLTSGEVAAYVTGALPAQDQARVEAHLSECTPCATEVIEVSRVLRTRPRRARWAVPAVAAAAAVLLVVFWPRQEPPAESSGYREPSVTTTVAPTLVAPRGAIRAVRELVWTAVPHADRYRLTLFDSTGSVVWETRTGDTVETLPDTLRLLRGAAYFWKVEAQTGVNRWVGSELVPFTVEPGP